MLPFEVLSTSTVALANGAVLFPKAGCLVASTGQCGTAPFTNATLLVDSTSTGNIGGITYVVRNSEHGGVPNVNYEVVLPNGYKIVFQDSGSSRIRTVKNIDVLLESVWTNDTGSCKTSMIQEMTLDKPGLTIPSHMHEMSHDTAAIGAGKTDGAGRCGGNRYSYLYPLEIQDDATVTQKFALLTWGEKIDFKR